MANNIKYLLSDNRGNNTFFDDLNTALSVMRNAAKYDSGYLAKCFKSEEIFNNYDFDIKSIIEKEITL